MRLKHLVASSAFAVSLVGMGGEAWTGEEDCGCDHVVEVGTNGVNGTELGFAPGDVVCVMAGSYEFIRFREIRGEPGNPIEIKNCGGLVEIRNLDRAYALDVQGSSHDFHLSGTGDPETPYGFRISAPATEPYPGIGLWMLDKSTNYEIDHVEVFDTGFAGVVAKTDPLCDGSADQGVFVQRDVHLHHLWVHDTGGEGFYVGSTQSNGQTISCNGSDVLRQPHFLEGIEIDHVLVENTGWDGAQIGMAHEDCSFHDNVIHDVGLKNVEFQVQGLQIGTYSSCDIRRNVLFDGPAMGVFVLGAYDTTVADNIIGRFAGDTVYANINMTPGPVVYRVVHNTLFGYGENATRVFGDAVEAVAWNNLVIGEESAIAAGGDVTFQSEGNLFVPVFEGAGFVDIAADDYHLVEGSAARGVGLDHAADGFTVDLDGLTRATPPSVGALEYAEDSPTTASSGGGIGDGGSSGDGAAGPGAGGGVVDNGGGDSTGGNGAGDGPDGESGCDCAVAAGRASPSHFTYWGAAALVFSALRRRARRYPD